MFLLLLLLWSCTDEERFTLVGLTAEQVPLPGSEDTSPTIVESLGSRH